MRRARGAAIPGLLMVVLAGAPAFAEATGDGAEAAKLDDAVLKQVAARFVKAAPKMAPGIWADVQACYRDAAKAANKHLETRKCLLLDFAGKALDDGMANRKGPNTGMNMDWYVTATFEKRIAVHAATAFTNPAAIGSFVANNIPPYMVVLQEAMKQGRKG